MERNVLVDRLKCYACFLVLFGHVIRGIRTSGINIPQIFEGIELFIWSFHVALFLFLSSVVYRLTDEWRVHKTKGGFVRYKLLGLGVPYFVKKRWCSNEWGAKVLGRVTMHKNSFATVGSVVVKDVSENVTVIFTFGKNYGIIQS